MRIGAGMMFALGMTALAAVQAPPQKFVPPPAQSSALVFRLDEAGRMPSPKNPTSPIVAGDRLLLIDQAGTMFVWDGARATTALELSGAPAGVRPVGHEPILNAAASADGKVVYVMFVSSSAPGGVPRRTSPRAGSDAFYVLVAYAFDGRALTAPRAIVAMAVRADGHTGGGMVVLPDGSVLFAAGDNGDSYEDGRGSSQDPAVHHAKLLRIAPAAGAIGSVAVGVRSPQRLVLTGTGEDARVSFVDPGGWVSEELNSVRVSALVAAAAPGARPLNFGWGRSPVDGLAREGTFFIDRLGNSTGPIGSPDDGFVAPVAEIGRGDARVFALSGPVAGASGLPGITALMGDLVGGDVFAVTGPLAQTGHPVSRVSLVDAAGSPVTLRDLAAGRPDPRFFTFPDGTAGVLLERTGTFYRITLAPSHPRTVAPSHPSTLAPSHPGTIAPY